MTMNPRNMNATQKISVVSWIVLLSSTILLTIWPWGGRREIAGWLLALIFLSELAAGPLTNHVALSPIMQFIDDRSPQDGAWYSILFGYRGLVLWYSIFLTGLWAWVSWGLIPWWITVAGTGMLFAMTGPHWLWPERFGW